MPTQLSLSQRTVNVWSTDINCGGPLFKAVAQSKHCQLKYGLRHDDVATIQIQALYFVTQLTKLPS